MPEAEKRARSGTTAFLESVVNLCRHSGNDWYRVYLIRKICSRQGVEFVLSLLKVDTMQWLFPEEVLQKVQLFTSRFCFSVQMRKRLHSTCNASSR